MHRRCVSMSFLHFHCKCEVSELLGLPFEEFALGIIWKSSTKQSRVGPIPKSIIMNTWFKKQPWLEKMNFEVEYVSDKEFHAKYDDNMYLRIRKCAAFESFWILFSIIIC